MHGGQTVDIDDTSSASASTSASVSPPSAKSDVWKYFEKSAGLNKAKCSPRSKLLLSYCGGTSDLREHLLTQHPFNYKPKAGSKKQAALCTVYTCKPRRFGTFEGYVNEGSKKKILPSSQP